METLDLSSISPVWVAGFVTIITILAIWDGVWKLIALWRAARNKDLGWFICIGVINTIGILPIIYLLTHKKKVEGCC
jgi:hypothetical protein